VAHRLVVGVRPHRWIGPAGMGPTGRAPEWAPYFFFFLAAFFFFAIVSPPPAPARPAVRSILPRLYGQGPKGVKKKIHSAVPEWRGDATSCVTSGAPELQRRAEIFTRCSKRSRGEAAPDRQALEEGPDARRRAPRHPEAYFLYVEGAASSPTKQMGPYRRPAKSTS